MFKYFISESESKYGCAWNDGTCVDANSDPCINKYACEYLRNICLNTGGACRHIVDLECGDIPLKALCENPLFSSNRR
jgi:hypothetical protein